MPRFTEFRTPEEFDSGGWQNKIIDEAQIDSRILQLVTSKDTVDYYNRWICVQVLDKTTRRLLQEIDLAPDEEGVWVTCFVSMTTISTATTIFPCWKGYMRVGIHRVFIFCSIPEPALFPE